MNKRLKEILKEYEERKHKIIKGDENQDAYIAKMKKVIKHKNDKKAYKEK